MSGKKLGFVLVIGGVVIGAIAYFGNQAVNKKSDMELLMETQRQMEKDAAELAARPLAVPESCKNVSLQVFETVCNNEVYEGEAVIPWATNLTATEASCVGDASVAKRLLDAAKMHREFDPTAPVEDWVTIMFACGVNSDLMLFVEDFDLEDPNNDAFNALDAWAKYLQE